MEHGTQNTERGTRNAERGTRNAELYHLFTTRLKLFLSYPLDIPPISHLYPISYKEVGYRWVMGRTRKGYQRKKEKDMIKTLHSSAPTCAITGISRNTIRGSATCVKYNAFTIILNNYKKY